MPLLHATSHNSASSGDLTSQDALQQQRSVSPGPALRTPSAQRWANSLSSLDLLGQAEAERPSEEPRAGAAGAVATTTAETAAILGGNPHEQQQLLRCPFSGSAAYSAGSACPAAAAMRPLSLSTPTASATTSATSTATASPTATCTTTQQWTWTRPVLDHCPKLKRRELRAQSRAFSLQEVQQHRYRDDAWIAVDGKVYDITEHIVDHPGWDTGCGVSTILSILAHAGSECTQEFNDIHRSYPVAFKQLRAFYIGELAQV